MVQSRADAYGKGRAPVLRDPAATREPLGPFDSLRRALGRALLPERDRRTLDTATRELLPPPGSRADDAPLALAFDLDLGAQLALLSRFEQPSFQDLFGTLRQDTRINPDGYDRGGAAPGLVLNGYYPTPDAEIYAALILAERPARIIEIGSGFSTAVAHAAVRAGGLDAEIHVIDPSPRRSVEDVTDRVEYTPVEHSSLLDEGVPPGSILFIDSSHVTRSRGDGPFLYGTLLPGLPPGVLVQIHDIYLPYDYPQVYVDRLYTEQYLLQALLANSTKFRPVLTTYLLSRRHPKEMRRAFGDAVARDGRHEGASFWVRSTG